LAVFDGAMSNRSTMRPRLAVVAIGLRLRLAVFAMVPRGYGQVGLGIGNRPGRPLQLLPAQLHHCRWLLSFSNAQQKIGPLVERDALLLDVTSLVVGTRNSRSASVVTEARFNDMRRNIQPLV